MPDLGRYAFNVLAAYGVTGLALALLVLQSLWRDRRVRRALGSRERQRRHG
jgi:heme exporter protein D